MQTYIALFVVALSFDFCEGAGTTPLHNAVKALEVLRDENQKTGEQEDAEYKVFTEWCRKGSKQLKFDVKDDAATLEDVEATKMKADSDISTFSAKIDDAAASQASTEGELKGAKAVRNKEHQTFLATEKELVDSINTLERASNVLQRRKKGAALVETSVNSNDIKQLLHTMTAVVNAASLSLHDQKNLMSLAQNDDAGMGETTGSGSGSTSVLDLIEDLKQKAENQLAALRKDETNIRYNFESVEVSLNDEIKLAAKELSEAKDANSVAAMTRASAENDMAQASKALASDKASLKTMEDSCVSKAATYDSALTDRKQEVAAIGGALKALKESSFLQQEGLSFLEIKSTPGFEVVNVLREFAQRKHTAALSQLAARVSAVMTKASNGQEANPFNKVSDMITAMVSKLEQEGASQASAKAFCEKAKKEASEKMNDLKFKTSKRNALVDKANSKVASLNEEISTLQTELHDMATQQATSDKMRRDAKKTFETLESDLTGGVAGVREALKLLRAQYGQTPAGSMSGILSMLELVEEDTSKSLATAKADESASASEYKKNTADNAMSKLAKETSQGYKSKEAKTWAKTFSEYSADLEELSTQLDAVKAEHNALQCRNVAASYAEKQAGRATELQGLKNAMTTLEGQASLLQRAPRRRSSLRGEAGKLQ